MLKKFKTILSNLKILRAHLRAHVSVRAFLRAFIDRKLTGPILTLMVINMNEKLLSVMKLWS